MTLIERYNLINIQRHIDDGYFFKLNKLKFGQYKKNGKEEEEEELTESK